MSDYYNDNTNSLSDFLPNDLNKDDIDTEHFQLKEESQEKVSNEMIFSDMNSNCN